MRKPPRPDPRVLAVQHQQRQDRKARKALEHQLDQRIRTDRLPLHEEGGHGTCEGCGRERVRRWRHVRWEPLNEQAARNAPHLGFKVLGPRACAVCVVQSYFTRRSGAAAHQPELMAQVRETTGYHERGVSVEKSMG